MFKKLALSAITFTVILAPMTAKAEWVTVGESNKAILSVDNKIKRIDDTTAFFWQRLVYKAIQSNDVKAAISYNSVSCDLMASRTHKFILYNDQGEVIAQKDYDEPLDWEYPVPGSRQEDVLRKICE
jgi:hypothetical protein